MTKKILIRLLFRDIPLQDVNRAARETTAAVVPGEQERLSDDQRRVSSSDINEKEVEIVSPGAVNETPVVTMRKDAVYQGSLQNIQLFNRDADEYNRQMATTSEDNDESMKKTAKKSFFAKVAEQIDLNLLKDSAFALFAISNFLTSLGFNVPYNFANDVASDAKVIEGRRHWIIMSIGIANCFGRVVIGYLGDQKWVKEKKKTKKFKRRFFLI